MRENVLRAVAFIKGLELPQIPRHRGRIPTNPTPNVFEDTKHQAMVVGADIVSFVAGTAPELREAVVNCSLLAQLAANCKVPLHEDISAWYQVYFDTLDRLGWAIQDRSFSEHREEGDDFEAHQAILSVAAVVLGPATAAFAVVQSTLTAMKSLSQGQWITIFQQESQAAKTARFQVTVAESASKGGCMISLMAFDLDAKTTLTQVLFFKFRSVDIKFRHSSARFTVDASMLIGVGPAIAKRVTDYIRSYVKNIPI
jgi:hypothetical protein